MSQPFKLHAQVLINVKRCYKKLEHFTISKIFLETKWPNFFKHAVWQIWLQIAKETEAKLEKGLRDDGVKNPLILTLHKDLPKLGAWTIFPILSGWNFIIHLSKYLANKNISSFIEKKSIKMIQLWNSISFKILNSEINASKSYNLKKKLFFKQNFTFQFNFFK